MRNRGRAGPCLEISCETFFQPRIPAHLIWCILHTACTLFLGTHLKYNPPPYLRKLTISMSVFHFFRRFSQVLCDTELRENKRQGDLSIHNRSGPSTTEPQNKCHRKPRFSVGSIPCQTNPMIFTTRGDGIAISKPPQGVAPTSAELLRLQLLSAVQHMHERTGSCGLGVCLKTGYTTHSWPFSDYNYDILEW